MSLAQWTVCQANSIRTLYTTPPPQPVLIVIYRIHNEGPAAVEVRPPDPASTIRIDPGEHCDIIGAPWINVALAGAPRCSPHGNTDSAKGTYELVFTK